MISSHLLQRTYRLLDRAVLSRLPEGMQRKTVSILLSLATRFFPSRHWPSTDRIIVRRTMREPVKSMRTLPEWAVDDMVNLSLEVDALLTHTSFQSRHPKALYAPTHWTQAGKVYRRLMDRIGHESYDTILLVPWLKRGGADLAALHHARLCVELGQRTLMVATEASPSSWAGRLPEGVAFLEIGSELQALSGALKEPEIVLARLLIQLAPRRMHLINSHTSWRTVELFGLAIRQQTRIFASLYCDELTVEGQATGLAQRFLPTTSHWLDAVITDNTASPESWVRMLGVREDLFRVAHFPAPASTARRTQRPSLRLLWASRLERQKRPDLLLDIATQMADFHWDVYGAPLEANDPYWKALAQLRNVTLHGSFDRFEDIVSADHLAYVYTTAWDGLPNVLLEAASAGLPIVSANIGGIRDLVPGTCLLPFDADAGAFVKEIELLTDTEIRRQRIAAQDARVAVFTWENFAKDMAQVEAYWSH